MEVTAQLNGLRMAPRKVRLVVGLIKDKDVDTALDQLAHLSNRASRPVSRTLAAAIANAENNHRMVRSNLYVKEAWVDEGIKLRRWVAKGFGRAGAIQKKSSQVNIMLDERVAGMRMAEQAKPEQPSKPEEVSQAAAGEPEKEEKKTPTALPGRQAGKPADETKPAKGLRGFGKKLFRRKSI